MKRWSTSILMGSIWALLGQGCANQSVSPKTIGGAERPTTSAKDSSREISPSSTADELQELVRSATEIAVQAPQRALGQLKSAAKAYPEAAQPHYNMGVIYERLGQEDQAEAAYQRALEIKPDYNLATENLANVLILTGRTEDAIRLLQAAVQSKPDAYALRARLCLIWIKLGQLENAEREAKGILKVDEQHIGALVVLANIFLRRGQKELATSVLERARTIKNQDARVLSMMGNVYVSRGQHPEALKAYEKALEVRSDLPEIHNNLGALQVEAQNFEPAIRHLEQAIALYPKYPEAYQNLGNALKGAKRYEEAEKAYRQSLELDGQAHAVLYNLGILHLDNQLSGVDRLERWSIAENYLKSFLAKELALAQDEKAQIQSLLVEANRGRKRTQKLIEREKRQELRKKGPEQSSHSQHEVASERL